MPTLVYAHGEEVILVFGIQLFLFLLFAIIISIVKIGTKAKLILSGAYIISSILIGGIVGMIPYRDNMNLVDNTMIIGPIIILLLTWLKIRPTVRAN